MTRSELERIFAEVAGGSLSPEAAVRRLRYQPLDDLVARRIPDDADPLKDVIFITRAGALFPIYRTSSLLEQLKGKVHVPSVLFYPGELDGVAGLRFMGILDAEHNYRPKIF